MNWKIWTPSKETREICSHLTKEEQKKFSRFGATNGLIVAIFFAVPLSSGLMWAFLNKSIAMVVGIILWILIGIPILLSRRRKGKELMCSAKWAQEQGYTPDKI